MQLQMIFIFLPSSFLCVFKFSTGKGGQKEDLCSGPGFVRTRDEICALALTS